MRLLNYWAAVAGAAVFCATGCMTSQDDAGGGGGSVEDPPNTFPKGGSGGGSQGGDSGKSTGGSNSDGGRSGAGGGGGGTDGPCSDDSDCETRVGAPRCSVPTGECVECLTASDCGGGAECLNNECRPITPCGAMNVCPTGLVCDTATRRCVECADDTDCRADETCANDNACHPSCSADGHCAPFGLICGSAGYCVSCEGIADCPDDRNCQNGTCVRDICVGGSGTCQGNVLTSCNSSGSGFNPTTYCPSGTICTEEPTARCATQICTPGVVRCSPTNDAVVECSDDGLDETPIEECDTGEFCIASTLTCMAAVCPPSMPFCQGNTVQQCNSTGTMSTTIDTCTTAEFCDSSTATCRALLCTPNQPACDGNVLRTCNATGTGYTGTGTDCTTTMQACSPSGCTDSFVDSVPASPTLIGSTYSNYLMVNFYSVNVNRTLTRIEYYMSPTAATALGWHVYESTTQTGTYTRISTSNSTSTTGAGYQSSPAVTVPLVAGRFYAIGCSWTTPALNMGYQTGAPTQTVSFGALINSYPYSTAAPTTTLSYMTGSSNFVPQRLTTTP